MAFKHRLPALIAALLLAACSNDSAPSSTPTEPSGPTGPTTPTVPATHIPVTLAITGPLTAAVGANAALAVVARDSAGTILDSQTIVWSSSDSTLIAVAGDGTVTPRRIGTVSLIAAAGSLRDTVTFASLLPPYTFVFPDSVSATDRQTIRDGVQYAHAFHKLAFGRTIEESTTVSGVFSDPGCASGGSAAFTGPRAVTFCLGNPGWKANGPVLKQKIVQHELFHVWQFEYRWISNPATSGAVWAIEGSAELMGYKGIAAGGLLSFDTGLGCQVKESSDFASRTPPGLPPLQSVESRTSFQSTVGPLYTHSMLAMQELTATTGLIALRAYGDSIAAGVEWHTAFQEAFGMTTTAFYAQFPGYVAGLAVPPNYLCGI